MGIGADVLVAVYSHLDSQEGDLRIVLGYTFGEGSRRDPLKALVCAWCTHERIVDRVS